MSGQKVPEGLHSLEYARHIIEYETALPVLTTLKLVESCITSISKTKGLTLDKAYKYLSRAISLEKEQGGIIDPEFFMHGKYLKSRPPKEDYVMTTQKRDEACAEHGCMSGWVYADKGVIRCEKCRSVK